MDFDRAINRHKNAIFAQMIRACGNRDDAEDVLVEAMLRAYQALPTLRDEGQFQGWLGIIAHRICSRVKRREALRPVLALHTFDGQIIDIPDEGMSDPAGRAALKNCVQNALGALPEIYRAVYELVELEERSLAETGESLGISLAATKSRLHRARILVREHLETSLCSPDVVDF